jgi:NADH-quinone oxidoreductase subunit G
MAEVAQDPVLDMRERGNLNEITVAPGRQLDGHYTFMTEHVCPVGALTTKDFRFKARVWFLRTAQAICQGCATGCNAHLDYDPRYNRAYRYRPRDNEKVNKFWMCDEGMLSYKLAHDDRVVEARVRGAHAPVVSALAEIKALFAGVSPQTVAVVLSAQHSLEDNWALRELATVLMGTERLYVSGRPDGYEDKILIHRDKNSNTLGVQELAPKARPFAALLADVASGAVTHVIALGGATPVDTALDRATVVTIAAHDGPLVGAAAVVLPATSWAEHSGTYVNFQGARQISEKALEPLGSSKPAWKHIADLAGILGYEAKWSKLKQVRAELTGGAASTATPAAAALQAE